MCGIAGALKLSNNNIKINNKLLHAMQQAIAHRGPDGHGVWKSYEHQVGFAHRRLSIIDLSSAASQPMLDKEKTVAICFNGEIYNHLQLRKELQAVGYQYFSNSDTETLIYAYKEWGINFLHRLDGMFAFALFDLRSEELYLVRDRIGIKPLYFSTQGGVLSFASEIKALWCLPWMRKKLNTEAFYHYLTFMVAPAPSTIFDQVSKLSAGYFAKVDNNKNVTFNQWYTPIKSLSASEQKEIENEDFCLEKIEYLLREATRKRIMSDVPFGAFLSGGVDSSLNVALMSEFTDKVKTFTVSFSDGPEFDELKWARAVAKKFGTQHHEIIISEKEAFNFYEKMIYHLDEPLADCVCIPFYYVAQLAKDHGVSVVQVGEGADELFFGYPTYASYKKIYDRYWNFSEKFVPKFLKTASYHAAQKIIPTKLNHLEILKNWADNKELFWGGALAFNEHQKKSILTSQFCKYDSCVIVDNYLSELKILDPRADFVKQMTFLELKQRLPELLLMRADKMAMAAGVEGRVPFLDHNLVEFMLNVPAKLKFKNNQTKYLLKKVAEKFLPKEVVYRKKVGFGAPTMRWFNSGKYFPSYFNKLREKSLGQNDLFLHAVKNIEGSYDNHETGFAVQKWVLQNYFSCAEK